jgi:hypothetical protein
MGVLLHRVSSEVVSASFEEHCAVLRLNSPRGLVGIIVVFDADMEPSDAPYAALKASLSVMMSERLTLMAVLTTGGEERALPRVVSAVTGIAQGLRWQPAFPVISSRTWEYADDRGSSAVLVFDTPAT